MDVQGGLTFVRAQWRSYHRSLCFQVSGAAREIMSERTARNLLLQGL